MKKTHTHLSISVVAVLLGAAVLAAGCKTGPYAAKSRGPVLENTETLVLLDKPLVKSISVDNQRAGYTADGRMVAEATLRNMTKKMQNVQVQTVFKDETGLSQGDETAWKTVILNPNAMETYQATALNASSKKYTIRVRLAR